MHEPRDNPAQQEQDDALLITRYCDGQLSPTEFDRLNDRLATDPALRELFIDLTIQAEHLETVVTRPEAVFDEFAYVPHPGKDTKVSTRSLASVGSYLIDEALHNRTVLRVLAVAAAVTVLGAALVLVLTFGGNGQDTDAGTAAVPRPTLPTYPGPSTPGPAPQTSVVATLTNTHNAVWAYRPAERALARGSQLHPNQRLTLTAGFAEITTARGAVAILEAPATIELTDNDNALRLHAGKLVGICETESSKGFLVKTDHAEITDLGTEFGVEVSADAATEVHVFEGEVEMMTNARAGNPTRLTRGQAAWAGPNDDEVRLIAYSQSRFTREIVVPLDVVDLLAGGDGTGRSTDTGIDPTNGQKMGRQTLPQSIAQFTYLAQPGFRGVNSNPCIDGVFIPHRGWDPTTITSTGLTYPGLGEAMASTHCPVWAGSFVPQPQRDDIPAGFDRDAINHVFADGASSPDDPRILVMHAPKGLTLDLDAIREQHPGLALTRFSSQLANGGDRVYGYQEDLLKRYGPGAETQADCLVLVDGQLRKRVRGIKAGQPPQAIEIEIRPGDRFLTLITISGSDQHNEYDWLLFGQPTIELRPVTLD